MQPAVTTAESRLTKQEQLEVQHRSTDLMLDLETFGTGPRAVIVSLGAVAFRPHRSDLDEMLYRVLDRDAQVARGRETDEATVRWWAEQSPEARTVLEAPYETVGNVLRDLRIFIEDHTVGELGVRVWGNGASFDPVLLESLHRDFGAPVPWKFYNLRCFRTLKELFGVQYRAAQVAIPNVLKHNAITDAMFQARCAQFIWRTK